MKPTLFILAAGMGSRYGGLKQMDNLGPSGETIMDYSVFDALRAGFGKIVFVIRKDFEKEFRAIFQSRFGKNVEVDFVFQSIDKVPKGTTYSPDRTKPWGTNHAVMMAEEVIKSPFAVINADDFYGKEAYEVMVQYLKSLENKKNQYCMVGYQLGKTLSESGAVSRGICKVDKSNFLTHIVECTHIEKGDCNAICKQSEDMLVLPLETPVSMNMWGFTPDYFEHSKGLFVDFLKENKNDIKAEFFIPLVVNRLIEKNIAQVKVLHSSATWFGVTYKEDRPLVVNKINDLVKSGVYPSNLWS